MRLNSEWQLLRERPTVLRRAHGWCLGLPFDNLDQVVAATDYWVSPAARAAAVGSTGTTAAGNGVVARLLAAGRSDEVAARVVLQRLLPGLIARSRCWGPRRVGGSTEAFDELVSAAWAVIREFPFERRPRHLIANLLRDSEYSAFQRTTRRMLVHELTEPRALDTAVEYQAQIEPLLELADLIAEARSHVLTDHDVEVLTLLANGASPAEAAKELQVSERTLRYHRAAAVGRLRDAALAAA
jgi:DNA-binding CsgD family transcriptional regulator